MYDTTKPFTKEIVKMVKETWETPYAYVKDWVLYDRYSCGKHFHTDGIGTKGNYHWQQGTLEYAVHDALAMNINDMYMMRAKPYVITDHLFVPEEDERVLEIMRMLVDECKRRQIIIAGGETACHHDMNGMELSIKMVGLVEEPKPNKFKEGDVLVGFKSNGLHSNGFTKIKEMFGDEYREDFTVPTIIYEDEFFGPIKKNKLDIHGMMHITGGAYTKLKGPLGPWCDAVITRDHKLSPQEIFDEIYERGVSDKEMYKTFNCGIGFIISISPEDTDKVFTGCPTHDEFVDVIGNVVKGTGKVRIESKFNKMEIEL